MLNSVEEIDEVGGLYYIVYYSSYREVGTKNIHSRNCVFLQFRCNRFSSTTNCDEHNNNNVQCVSLDSTSLVIYPEIKATEVPFQS